ncbi:nanos homolog 2 [Mantella aurantiaca]
MEFQLWRDYLQLASVIQAMAKAEIYEPPPLRNFLLSPAERPEEDNMNEQNDHVQLNAFLANSPSQSMGYPYSKMNLKSLPTSFYNQANSLLHSTNDHATAFEAIKTQPNSLPNHGKSNSHQTKTSIRQNSSPPHEETPNGGMCCFCKHNGESRHIYMGHNLKDDEGRVICPVLRMYSCSLCGATGDSSHTKKYCPLNKDKHCLYTKSGRNSSGRKVKR